MGCLAPRKCFTFNAGINLIAVGGFFFAGVGDFIFAGVVFLSVLQLGSCCGVSAVLVVAVIPSLVGVKRLWRGFLLGVGVFTLGDRSCVSCFGARLVRSGVRLVQVCFVIVDVFSG